MGNVAGLTNRPMIRLKGSQSDSDDNAGVLGDPASGELIIEKEIYTETRIHSDLRNERYTLPATYHYHGTSETIFKLVIEEINRTILADESATTYYYEMVYDWDTNLEESVANIVFVLRKLLVSI